ncbi:unnamed protein product [Ectocarpus fasciculatus]
MPQGERRYQIYLKSPLGPIDVYVVSQVDERIEPAPEDEDGDVEEEAGGGGEESGGGKRADKNGRRHQTEERKPQHHHHENQARKQKQNHQSASAHDPSGFHRGQEDPRARHSRLQRQQQQRQEGIRGRGEGVDAAAGRHPPPAGQQTPGRLGGAGSTAAVAAERQRQRQRQQQQQRLGEARQLEGERGARSSLRSLRESCLRPPPEGIEVLCFQQARGSHRGRASASDWGWD